MDDERCRITVVGSRRRVDLAVPARAPIAEYVSMLTGLCGEQVDETLPAACSLALAGKRPIPLGSSLIEAQVVDGATLYLRDAIEGEIDEPLISDVDELVEDASGRWTQWTAGHLALTIVVAGLAAFVVSLAVLVIRSPGAPLPGAIAVFSGLGLALLAGVAGRRPRPLSAPLTLTVALAACPVMALAGYGLPTARHSGGAAAISVVVGANIGALAALLATVGVCTLVVQMFGLLILPITVLLVVVGASGVECAAVAGVSALAVLGVAPSAAGRLGVMAPRSQEPLTSVDASDELAQAVGRGRRTLIAITLVASLVLTLCLAVLGDSENPFAVGLAVCLSLAALAHSMQTTIPAVVMPVLAAALAGLVATAIQAPGHLLAAGSQAGPMAVYGIGTVVLCAGIGVAMRPAAVSGTHPSWVSPLGVLFSALTVPLAFGVFGVFEYLAALGGNL